jgi:predicted metal-dependent hydrolase
LLGKKNCVEKEDCFLKLRVKNMEDTLLKKKVLDKWLNYQVEEIVNRLCEKAYLEFKKYCGVFPLIRYRKMKSRWGSCHTVKKILTFNYALINAPIECVEYVVYHEFTHFIEPNHSKKFYLTLGEFLPDYKERRRDLRKILIGNL